MTTQLERRGLLCSVPLAIAGWIGLSAARPIAVAHDQGADDTLRFLDAVRAGDEPYVRRSLVERPALAATRDAAGLSALLHAHLAGHAPIAALLVKAGLELDIAECVFESDWKRMTELATRDPKLVNALHPIGGNLLYAGALAGTPDLYRIRALGCDPDGAPDGGSGRTPARAAMDQRTLSGARIAATDLLSNGSSVVAPQRAGDSVLHGAVRRRSDALVRLALRKGADVGARDVAGRTALDLARELEWSEGAQLLENHQLVPRDHRASRFWIDANGAPVRRPSLDGVSQAVQNQVTGSSHANLARLRELVSADARLIYSVSTDDELAIEACAHTGNREIMRFHLDHGAPCSLPTAASMGDVAMLRHLLDLDPRLIHERGAHDFAPMHYAAIGGGGVEVAALLHERGAPIDQETIGLTALHWSVSRDMPDLTAWLLEKGADVAAVSFKWDRNGQTPLQIAFEEKLDRQIRLLRDAGAR